MNTDAPIGAYRERGFVAHAEPVLTPDEVAAAAAGLCAVRDGAYDTGTPPNPSPWRPGDDPTKLVKIEQPHYASRALQAALRSPRLGEAIGRITGADFVQVWHVQGLVKPSVDGGAGPQVGWHQDWQYWAGAWAEGSELMTAWLALSDVTPDSGPLLFVPGSHRWGRVQGGDFYSDRQSDLRTAIEAGLDEGQTWDEVAAPLPPGGFSLHDKLTLHGSAANTSGRPRMSLAIHLRTGRSTGDPSHPWCNELDNDAKNPVIWDAR